MTEKQEHLPTAAAASWVHGNGPARLTLVYAASVAPRLVPGQVVRYDGIAVQVHTLVVENREGGGTSATYVLHALPLPGNSPLAWHETKVEVADDIWEQRLWWRATCEQCGPLGAYGTQRRADLEAHIHRAGTDEGGQGHG